MLVLDRPVPRSHLRKPRSPTAASGKPADQRPESCRGLSDVQVGYIAIGWSSLRGRGPGPHRVPIDRIQRPRDRRWIVHRDPAEQGSRGLLASPGHLSYVDARGSRTPAGAAAGFSIAPVPAFAGSRRESGCTPRRGSSTWGTRDPVHSFLLLLRDGSTCGSSDRPRARSCCRTPEPLSEGRSAVASISVAEIEGCVDSTIGDRTRSRPAAGWGVVQPLPRAARGHAEGPSTPPRVAADAGEVVTGGVRGRDPRAQLRYAARSPPPPPAQAPPPVVPRPAASRGHGWSPCAACPGSRASASALRDATGPQPAAALLHGHIPGLVAAALPTPPRNSRDGQGVTGAQQLVPVRSALVPAPEKQRRTIRDGRGHREPVAPATACVGLKPTSRPCTIWSAGPATRSRGRRRRVSPVNGPPGGPAWTHAPRSEHEPPYPRSDYPPVRTAPSVVRDRAQGRADPPGHPGPGGLR